jgi:long-chain acyl-CoA synthetase
MYDTLVNRICALAVQQPEKLAVAFKKEQLTYAQLNERVRLVGNRLRAMGINRGDRVLFTALSKPEMVAVYLGIQYCGAIAVFIDKNATLENIDFVYGDTGASLILTDKPLKEYSEKLSGYSLKAIYNNDDVGSEENRTQIVYSMPSEDDTAELLFTTGTTGKPKGVILTYKAVYNILKNTIYGIGIRPDERLLLPLPLNHSFALRVLRAVLYQGATVVLQNGFTFAKEIENNLEAYGCTAISVVPASVETIARQMQDKFAEIMGRFRFIEAGAGSLTIEQRKRLVRLIPNTTIFNTWGSSESGGALFINVTEIASDSQKIGSLGKPINGIQIKVLDEDGNEIQSDREHPGRMALKGDMQMAGYWNRDDLTKATLKDGWLLTSDMIYKDLDGYVYMLGRADDIINVGGEKVSPIEVEEIAGEYPHIRECACIGVPDPEEILGFVPILFVAVKDNSFSEDDIHTYLSSRMERYKLPAHYVKVQELPRNRMQKIDRKALREIWNTKGSEDLMNPVMQAILTRRSIRKFQDKPVPRELLDMLVQAGYYAPSGHNMQTWRFTVVTRQEDIQRLKEQTKIAAEANKVYFYGFENPQALILVSNDNRNKYSCQDASCAAENIMIAATSYGLGTCWLNPLMTLRDVEPIKNVIDDFGIPKNHTVWSAIAIGYPSSDGTLLAKKTDVVCWV